MWMRFSQWPTSWVAVRPRLNGAVAVPVVPKLRDSPETDGPADSRDGWNEIVIDLKHLLTAKKVESSSKGSHGNTRGKRRGRPPA
jgi:hypothetical protein